VELLESDALDDAVGSGESLPESVVSLLPEDPEQAATKKSSPNASSSVFHPIFSFLNNRDRALSSPQDAVAAFGLILF